VTAPQPWTLRRATADDAGAVTACVHDAFRVYIPRLGVEPRPMQRDYEAIEAAGVGRHSSSTVAALLLDDRRRLPVDVTCCSTRAPASAGLLELET
jgi:hypothetical protein